MSKKIERKVSFKSISGDDLKDFYSSSNKEKDYNINPGIFPTLVEYIKICIEENYGL